MTEPVRRSVTVKVPLERAWEVYTAGYGTWYPKDHHLGAGPAETVEIEPRAGGRWVEKHADGTELLWGRVKEWEPPRRLLLSWMVGGDWQCDPDESHASEIEVTFTAVDAGTTEVVLEHRHLDRHGDGTDSIVQGVADDSMGHAHYLHRFAAAAEERPAG